MKPPVWWRPTGVRVLAPPRYEVSVLDADGRPITAVCTVVVTDLGDTTVSVVQTDPDFVSHGGTDPRPLYETVLALHAACTAPDLPP